jgi:hypothetical protein
MNLHRLVAWADQLLQHSSRGAAKAGSVLSKLRNSLDQLPSCKAFIQNFLRDAIPLLECQNILKTKGLNTKTYQICEKLVSVIPENSPIRNGFMDWAQQQLDIATTLKVKSSGLPISTDVLESLFGVGKRLGTGQIKDADRIASRLPAFCGGLSQADAEKVMAISVKQQQALMGNRQSLTQQRRAVLSNPKKLESLAHPLNHQNVQLIRNAASAEKSIRSATRIPEDLGKLITDVIPSIAALSNGSEPPDPSLKSAAGHVLCGTVVEVEKFISPQNYKETTATIDFDNFSVGAFTRNGISLEMTAM